VLYRAISSASYEVGISNSEPQLPNNGEHLAYRQTAALAAAQGCHFISFFLIILFQPHP
jgi:hypothetical protein